ncbi:MAG: hypothetical protein AAFR35_02410 [Pseudomonadota bacterium]
MKYAIASVAMVFFGWLGTAILTDSLPRTGADEGRAAALLDIVDQAIAEFGVTMAGWGAMGVGIALALIILLLQRSDA